MRFCAVMPGLPQLGRTLLSLPRLRHQLEAFHIMLKNEMDPIMKKMHVDAWVISNNRKLKQHIGRRTTDWKGQMLRKGAL